MTLLLVKKFGGHLLPAAAPVAMTPRRSWTAFSGSVVAACTQLDCGQHGKDDQQRAQFHDGPRWCA